MQSPVSLYNEWELWQVLNILIADDDKNLCECLLLMMPWKEMNCNPPYIVYDGSEAWELLQKEKIDLVISDLKMPVMEGIELSKLIHENSINAEIVFLSAYEDFSIAKKGLQYGVTDYILKPINRESLNNVQKIISVINDRKNKDLICSRFYDEEYSRKVFNAICSRNTEFLQNMFDDMKVLNGQQIITIGIMLLHTLHDYLCMISKGMEHSIYDTMLKKWCSDILKLNDTQKQIQYIQSKYQCEVQREGIEREGEQIVDQIMDMVNENYEIPDCNVAWIAERLHLTSSYVGGIFAKNRGVGLMEYIIEYRMEKACQMLSDEHIPISSVGIKVGYTDANYFTKAFKNKIGMSPSEYRRCIIDRKVGEKSEETI